MVLMSLAILLVSFISMNIQAAELPGADINVNLSLREVSLRAAFRALADVAGMNIIADNSVQGTVTLNLENITFLEAVELLSKTNGLSYRIIGNTVLIASPDRLQSGFSEKVTKVFELKNSQPEEVKKSLNLLVDDKELRIDNRTNSLVVNTYKTLLPEIKAVIDSLDKPKKQIALQARIEEVSRDKTKELGINWGFGNLNVSPENSTSSTEDNNIVEIGSTELGYKATLNLLESNGDATLLANPQIATIDGEEASINIGDEVPIITTVTTDTETRDKVEFKDIGINLLIIPRVTNNEKIVVKVKPEVSTISGYITSKATGNSYPQISTRKAQTRIRVQDGKTIAIGGLIKDKEIESLAKVPFLGALPMLGKLFQSKSIENKKTELIIFITPKIISDGKEVESEFEKAKQIEEAGHGKIDESLSEGQEEEERNQFTNEKIIPFDYKVRESDTFWSISRRFDISFTKIMDHNDIEYIRPLEAGEILSIPIARDQYYKVQEGDTIESIAEEYKIKAAEIMVINDVHSLKGKAGTKLVLPVKVKAEDRYMDSDNEEAYPTPEQEESSDEVKTTKDQTDDNNKKED
jgi:type IV pilus assembly protein PilQ